MLLPYLDINGYEMKPEQKPIFLREVKKAQSMERVARYVQCRRKTIKGLIWIGNCECCKWFGGHVEYRGINCNVKQ